MDVLSASKAFILSKTICLHLQTTCVSTLFSCAPPSLPAGLTFLAQQKATGKRLLASPTNNDVSGSRLGHAAQMPDQFS